uniref:BTB domain-containing protein n=1 Tax=Branchiostoma floridae TaxID=7739 RepID=C4A088_BRAFL|eukprot:XP_002585778.1 hypothetical protein BRAFLDRAFT_111136 [Branchiostoma floridae]
MSGNIKSVMNVKASKVNLNPSVLLRKLSDEEVLRNTTPEKFHKTGKQRASVSADTEKSFEVRQSKSDSERKQDSQKKVEVTKPLSKSTEQNPSQAKPSTATEVPQKKVAKPASEAKAQHKPTEGSVIESVKDVVGKETSAPSRSTVTEDLLTQISLSAPVKEVKKVVQVLTLDDIPGKSDKSEGKRSQLIEKDSQKVSAPKEMTTMMTESRNLSVVVPKLPMHISPQKSYNINDPSITPSKAKPRTPTAKEALARKMVKKAKTRANGKGAALNFKRLIGENGNLDNSSDFVETGKTFQPAVRKLRSRAVKKAAKDKVRKPASPDTTVSTEKGPGKTSSVPVNVENKEGKTCLTCKQTIFGTEEAVKEHMKTCLRQRFVSDKHSSRHTGLRHLPEPAEEGLMDLEVSDDESFARHLQQREEDKLMEEQLTDAEFYFCQICGRDLTHLNTVRRTQHINRCIDAMETEKKLHAEQNIKDVPDCPICGKVLESRAQRQSHLKRCAVQYGVTTAQLLELVKKQEEEKEARRKNQPRSQLQPAQQQQREMDERTQVAMAMSMSLVEKEGSREQPTVTSALPVGGKESKRRKKAAKTDVVPALLVTSKEDREKTLARKVASIIVQGDQESHPKTPSLRKSKLGRKYHTARKTMGKGPSSPSFLQKVGAAMTSSPPAASTSTAASPASSQEKAPLWSMTKRIDEKKTDDFYVQELSKQITPAKYVPVTPMRKAAKKAMLTFTKKNDTSEDETTDGPPQKAVAGSQKAKKTPTATRSPVKKSTPTPTQTQRETANVLAELADEGCSTQEVQEVFTEGQTLLPEPSGFVPDRTPLSPQKMPSSVPSTTLTKLSADLLGMVNSPKLSDLNLLCRNGEVIHVHKFVLVARCPVIAKMLEVKDDKDLAALDFSDYEKDTVLTTLEYMYGGKISLSDAVLAANVLRVAQKLELKELEDSCKAFLKPTFSTVSSSPEFQEKDLPELLDTMLGSPTSSPNLSQGSVNRSSDSQGFNDSELEDIALSQKQRFQKARTLPSKNVNKEPAATKKPTQMVPPAGRGLGQAPERQETGLHVPVMTIGDVVESAIVKNVKQPTRIGPDASPTSAPAHQPILTSTGQTAGVGVRIPVEHSYSTSPRKGTQRGRRGPKTTVAPMLEGSATTVSPAKQPASLAPSMQGIATTVMTSTHGLTTTVMPSTHAVTSTATLSSSQLGVATAVTQASPAQTTMGSHSALPRPGAREQSLIIQSQELSNKIGCPECEKSGVRVSANEAQMLIQGGPAANAMRQLIIARQRPCPHGKYPSWGSQVAPTWMPPHAPEALQGRSAGQLLAGLRSRTPPNSPLRQTAVATVVTPAAPGHTHTSPAYTQSPSGARMQNFAEFNSPPFGPGRPQPDVRLPGSRPPIPPLPGFGILPPGGRLPPASTLLPRTNILAQLREPSQFAQQRYGPQGVVPEQFPTQRSPRGPAISPISSQRSGKELDSPTSSQNGSELIPSRRLLLHTAQRMLPGNQYLSNQFLSPTGLQRPTLHDNTPRLSVVAESSPPPNTSTGVAIIRIPSPMEKSGQGRSERHSWSSLVRRERSTDDCSILKVLLQKGVGAAIPQLYKDQEVPPHIQKQVLKETRLKRLMPQTKQHDVQPASQACGEMVVGRNCSGEVHGGIVVADTNIRKQMVTRESGAGLHDSHSGAQKQCREVVKGVEHGGSLVKQGKDELAGEESGTESLSCPTADELRDSMLFRIVHPETFSPVPKIKGKPVHDGGEVGKVQGKELHAVKLTREKVLTKDCSPMVGEGSRHQKEGNGVAAVCDSDSSVQNVVKQCTTSKVEEDTDCDELRSTFTGPNAKQRRGKATSATTFPSSSPDTMSRHYTSPMLRGSVEIVVNSDREQPASERQEPDIGKVPSIFDNNQGVSIPRDQGNNRVSRRASQRKNQTTPTEATMPSSQATNSVQTRSKGGKQKGETTPSPTKRLRMSRPPEGKRHACTQSPKKFWTDYLKAQLASGNAPAGPVGESMISMQTPDLSAVKPVRRGISSPELALTTPGVTGSTTFQPKFSTPVGSHTQPVGSPRLSLDQELKEAETETVFHGTGPEPYAPTVEKKTSLDSGSQQADDATGKDVDDDVECIAGNSVDDVGLGDVEKIDLTQEHADETGAEPQQGVCGTEHGCGTPEHEQPSSPSSQSKPAEEQQSQSSQPSVVNDSLMDFFDDGGYMEVPFGGEVECAADSSDDKINLSSVTSKTESKDDKNADELSPSLDATKDNDTTASVPLSPKNASTVIEEFPDTQQEPVHVEEDAHTDQYVVEVVEESPTAGEDVVNNSMYDLEPYHEDHFWDDSNEPQPDESTPVHSVVGSGETGTGAVKSTPLQTHRKSKAPVVPITPMPDYPNMETPELKKQVKKFGVRVLKKPQMVAKLTEIYQYTHQELPLVDGGRSPFVFCLVSAVCRFFLSL